MRQVRHHNLDTGHTEDIGDPVPNRKAAEAEALAKRLNNEGVGHDRDLFYTTEVKYRKRHPFPVS